MRNLSLIFAVIATALLPACIHRQMAADLGAQVENAGEIYTQEVEAQSPFQVVHLNWSEALELAGNRNSVWREAAENIRSAQDRHSLVGEFTSEIGASFKNTLTTALNPSELGKLAAAPMTQIPVHIDSLTSFREVPHEFEEGEWEVFLRTLEATRNVREALVGLYVYFKQFDVLEEQQQWLKDAEAQTPEDSKLVKNLTQRRQSYEAKRKEWIREIRDFFDAEYYDVRLHLRRDVMPSYRRTENPELQNWKRWRLLPRIYRTAEELKKRHGEENPQIPGTQLVKERVLALAGRSQEDSEADDRALPDTRSSVRELLQQWRELKNTQRRINELRRDLEANREAIRNYLAEQREAETTADSDGASEAETKAASAPLPPPTLLGEQIQLRQSYFDLRLKEIELASQLWRIDEECWPMETSGPS